MWKSTLFGRRDRLGGDKVYRAPTVLCLESAGQSDWSARRENAVPASTYYTVPSFESSRSAAPTRRRDLPEVDMFCASL